MCLKKKKIITMNASAAVSLFQLAVEQVEEVSQQRVRGQLRADSQSQLEDSIQRLSEVTQNFMSAFDTAIRSGFDDLLSVNSRERVTEHVNAYLLCEQAVDTFDSVNVLEASMALTAADAVHVSVVESKPLRAITLDEDIGVPLIAMDIELPTLQPILVSQTSVRKRLIAVDPGRRPKPTAKRKPSVRRRLPTTSPKNCVASQQISGVQVSEQEMRSFMERVLAFFRGQIQRLEDLPAEIIASSARSERGNWADWAKEKLEDPSTAILDTVAAVSCVLANRRTITTELINSAAWKGIMMDVIKKRLPQSIQQRMGSGLSNFISNIVFKFTDIASSFSFLYNVYQQNNWQPTFLPANVVELVYGFVTLLLPTPSGLTRFSLLPFLPPVPEEELPEQMRSLWFRQIHYWAPFLSLVSAMTLIVGSPLVASYIAASLEGVAFGDVGGLTPGGIITGIARSWLDSDSSAVELLEGFYELAAPTINSMQQFSIASARPDVPLTLYSWVLNFMGFVSRLHRLRAAAPMLHLFSLAERAVRELTVLWRWAAVKLQRLFSGRGPTAQLVLSWIVTAVDLVLLMIQSGLRMLRYHGIIVLLYTLVSSLAFAGIRRTIAGLQVDPVFEIQWGQSIGSMQE